MRQVQVRYADRTWYHLRAHHALGLGQNDLAARDVAEYLDTAGWSAGAAVYSAFIGAIAHQRLGQQPEADALLAEVAKAVAQRSWEAATAQYLHGKLTDAAFLDRANDDGERLPQACTYIGLRALIGGRTDEARQHFEWVKEREIRNDSEYRLALAA